MVWWRACGVPNTRQLPCLRRRCSAANRKAARPSACVLQDSPARLAHGALPDLARPMLMANRRFEMIDFALVAVTLAFFAISVAYVWACDRV